jgi:hypothetical protein
MERADNKVVFIFVCFLTVEPKHIRAKFCLAILILVQFGLYNFGSRNAYDHAVQSPIFSSSI